MYEHLGAQEGYLRLMVRVYEGLRIIVRVVNPAATEEEVYRNLQKQEIFVYKYKDIVICV